MKRYNNLIERMNSQIAAESSKREHLRNLDCIVLDNSLRESTVGQLRGHTLENKMKIYQQVKKCGFKNIIVASFGHMTRVDDVFLAELVRRGEDTSRMHAFSEVTAKIEGGVMDTTTVPVGLAKLKNFDLHHPIFEIDLADHNIEWETKFTPGDAFKLLHKWIKWSQRNLSKEAQIYINLRDFPFVMQKAPERVFELITFLASLPQEQRPVGLMYEEPTGEFLPEELGVWTAAVRNVMDANSWDGANLLVHVHKKWGFADHAVMECLSAGANGVWSSVCEEGAAVGHACSTVALMNLIRLGNKKVLKRYKCTALREAARKVTEITTGDMPPVKQIVYGERSLDISFDFGGIAGGRVGKGEFDLAKFFGIKPPMRINSLSSPRMIRERLINLFGKSSQFTLSMAQKMIETMLRDLRTNRKEEYMSACGLALLFDRSGGRLTAKMRDVIDNTPLDNEYERDLIADVRKIWDTWDLKEKDGETNDDRLEFDSFYNGFMAPYFGCFRCEDTRLGLRALDMDHDGDVDWSEFLVYLKWAVREYEDIKDADELLAVVFRKGIMPAMRDHR